MVKSHTLLASLLPTLATAGLTFKGPSHVEAGGVQNIHVDYTSPIDGELKLFFGSCDLLRPQDAHHLVGQTHIGAHPLAKRHLDWTDRRPTRFVWLAPQDVRDGCLHAFLDDVAIGTSRLLPAKRRKAKRAFADIVDPIGPWFDGVALLQDKQPDDVFVASVKSKSFGILGAGMSGLMTAYLLDSVGINNWKIIESSNRLGGRVHTSYLNGSAPEDYQYQEMGPMRFPVSLTLSGTNETIQIQDHRMVFQLADALNDMNNNDTSLSVDFIRWIQSNRNAPSSTTFRRLDGTVPSVGEVLVDPALTVNATLQFSDPAAVAAGAAAYNSWVGVNETILRNVATNLFKAHRAAFDAGNFHFSDASYLQYELGLSANVTDQITDLASNSPSWIYDNVYFSASQWLTIDKGLSRLPLAFTPLVSNRIQFNSVVQGISHNSTTNKVTVSYLPSNSTLTTRPSTETFDYITVAVPFTKVRLWRRPLYSSLLTRAITRLTFASACKVALHYRTRFWEHLPLPILGGCGSTDIPGVNSICYPSYNLNGTGPGVLLASYNFGQDAATTGALKEADHVALVQRAMVEVHGPIAAQEYTGIYDRKCWADDEHTAAGWASPSHDQQPLYLPAYFRTEFNTVFVGEHTSQTHAWIWSALESAVRGTAQLLLELGLVDEAKEVVETWMGRWISI